MATGFADRYVAEFEEDKHPRDDDGQFTLKVSKIHGPKGEKFENLGGKQQDLFAFRGEKGQMNLFSDAGVPDELLPNHLRKGKPDTYAKDEDPPESGPQWMTLGGGARALVDEDGTILKGCEGVKGYELDELDETRDERAAKQEQAEDAGWTSAKSDRARETWEAFKQSDPTHPHFIGLVRHGGKFHAFDESAGKLLQQLGIGDGQTAEFDEDKLPHHMERLIENGHRVAVIDRAEDGTPDLDSDADPEAQQAVAEAHEDVAEQQETKPAAAGFGIEPVHPERLKLTQDGREIGYMNLRVMGDRGYIDDTSIHAAARGQGVMRQLWPQIEQHFRDQGATSIRADVVDPAVGEKVWGPLGFQKEGMSGPVEVYRKHLDSPAAEVGADREQATDKPLWQQTLRDAIPDDKIDDQAAFDEHRQAVEQALQAGQQVPEEVLADYPDIREQRIKSQAEQSHDVLSQLQDRDELSRDDIGRLLASQHHNIDARAKGGQSQDAESLADKWVDSPSFVKMEIPIDVAQSATAVQEGDRSVSPGAPIVVDSNKTGAGRLHGSFGAPADFLILDGKHRHAAAKARGEKTITAFVGSNAVPRIKAILGQAASESDQQEQTPADTAGEADDWNAAIQSPAEATDDQLARAIEFASHLHGHHQRNAQSGQITPEQLTSLHDMIDGHVATMQAELERRKHAQPAERGNAAASPGGTDDASATGAETRPTSGTAAADPGPTGSLGTRHHDAGQRIAQAPGPVRSLLESLHRLRDTRKTGQVETKELGHEYAREMYDHLKSLRHAGDDFGEVHDLSQELGHGAIGYASPAGNVAMVPPKFKGQDWQVRYTLPHESQQAPAASPADAPSEPADQGDELDDVLEGDAYEGDLPASDAGGGFPWEDAGQDEPPTAPSQQPEYSDAWRDLHAQHQDLVYRTIPHREQQYRQAVSQAQRDQQRFAAKAAEYQSQADQLESATPRDPAHAVRMKSDRPYAEARRRIDKLRKMSADLDRKADEAKLHPRIEFARQQLAASQSAAEQLAQQKAEAGGALAPEVDPDTGKSISRRAYLAKQRAAGRAGQQGKGVSPRTPLGRAIIAAVGDDPVEQQHFGEVLKEIHANDIDAVRNRNDAIKETLANFGFMGRDAGKFLQAIRKYEDADQFLRKSPLGNKFDQMTEYALTHFGGEVLDVAHTRAHDDPESAFFETLQRGLKRVPEPHDDEVVSKALEYYLSSLESSRAHQERLKTDPAYREEMAAIERGDYTFSRQGAKIRYARWARQRLSRWYRYARQLSLFDDPGGLQPAAKSKPKGKQKGLFDEDDHPRATEHVEIKGKSYEGGQWIPKDEAAQASPAAAEKIEVVDQDTGQAQPLNEVEEQPPESPVAEPASAEREPFEFKTAAQAAQEGLSFASWQQPISDAFRHERIDEDHPAWQAVLNAPKVSDYNDAMHVFGKHVLAHAGQQEVFGTVTALSDDLQSGTITMPDGREAKHFISNMNDLGPFLQDRLKRYIATKGLDETREALARSEAAKYLAGVMAQEAFQKQTNIGDVIKDHGFGLKEGMAIRSMVADEFMKLQEAAKPQASDARKRAQEKRRQTDEEAETIGTDVRSPWKEGQLVTVSGSAPMQIININKDGTLTVAPDGDKSRSFNTEPGESIKDATPQASPKPVDTKSMSRGQFVANELRTLRDKRQNAVRDIENKIREQWKPKGLPVGASAVQDFLLRDRVPKELKHLKVQHALAVKNLDANTVTDEDHFGRVWDRLNATRQSEALNDARRGKKSEKTAAEAQEPGQPVRTAEDILRDFAKANRDHLDAPSGESSDKLSSLRREYHQLTGRGATMDDDMNPFKHHRPVDEIQRDIDRMEKRLAKGASNYKPPLSGGTRASGTTFAANQGKNAQVLKAYKDELKDALAVKAPKQAATTPTPQAEPEQPATDGQELKHEAQKFGVLEKAYQDVAQGKSMQQAMRDRIAEAKAKETSDSAAAEARAVRRSQALSEWESELPNYSDADLATELAQHQQQGRTVQAKLVQQEIDRRSQSASDK